ncbi:MAG: SAM-dependent chlorinase/fluorinase [Candidatus Aminicenantes bacterium]|nr:SAM-dependent chlorinase/fluorinase [Candidatus Aminicenantes bacterium]
MAEILKIKTVDNPVIALLTDFGDEDFFVASLKGVIAGINPLARTIDITHRIPSFDTAAASFVLFAACSYFPPKSVFLVVVDPGVGSGRKILLVETARYFFIAPDNGVLSLVLENEQVVQAREITNSEYFLSDISRTFEGRDKMAPVAAWLTTGIPCEKFGAEITSFKRERGTMPEVRGKDVIGSILYIDKFGNVITDIPAKMIEGIVPQPIGRSVALKFRRRNTGGFDPMKSYTVVVRKTYDTADKGDLLILTGSLGLLELAVKEDSAADRLGIRADDGITLSFLSVESNV